MRRKFTIVLQIALLSLVVGFLTTTFAHFASDGNLISTVRISSIFNSWRLPSARPADSTPRNGTTSFLDNDGGNESKLPTEKTGNKTLLELAQTYVDAITNPNYNSIPRLQCPSPGLKKLKLRPNRQVDTWLAEDGGRNSEYGIKGEHLK